MTETYAKSYLFRYRQSGKIKIIIIVGTVILNVIKYIFTAAIDL